MKPKSRLGRGIDAIFPEAVNEEGLQVCEISIEDIFPNPIQPRKEFDEEKISELAASIAENGIISPIVVRQVDSRYEIIAGERRYRASRMAGLPRIPAIIKELPDDDAFRISLIENIQREDLNPLEEAEAYYTLKHQFNLTHQEIAVAVSKDRSTVTNALRLISLPEECKQALREGLITNGHARAILMVEELGGQLTLLQRIIRQGLNVREAERLAATLKKKPAEKQKRMDPYTENVASRLADHLAAKVSCSLGRKKGKIVIEVTSREELDRIVNELTRSENPL